MEEGGPLKWNGKPLPPMLFIFLLVLILAGCSSGEAPVKQVNNLSEQTSPPQDEGDSSTQTVTPQKQGESSPEREAVSPNGVNTLAPEGAIEPTGTWSVGVRAGDFVFVAGMRGIDPETGKLVEDPKERIRQAFMNMKLIAESEGADLQDATRIVVYVADMYRYRPVVNEVQEEFWGSGPYPPRTIIEVDRMNEDDIFEVEGTFYAPEVE